MADHEFPLNPSEVPLVETKYRKIATAIPVPESLPILERLRQFEPRSMQGQPPVIWDRAEGIHVYDRWGNKWIDWSSGVLVTNAGHCHAKIKQSILDQVSHGLLFNYCFPSEIRAQLVAQLAEVAPEPLKKVFLLTTGAEAVECAVKLARSFGLQNGGNEKITVVTFDNAFHGRTLGAQMAGGIPALKQWIVNVDPNIVQVPFPDGFRNTDISFDGFLQALDRQGIVAGHVAGVITETYQGGNSSFAPSEYVQQLRQWCDQHGALLVFDEVQAGFGRCGTYWGFEQYGVKPDLICCGKGISSGPPLSAVIGRAEVMDIFSAGSMTSTHTGNALSVAGALANLQAIAEDKLVENAAAMGELLQPELRRIGGKFPEFVGEVHGRGLVGSLHIVQPGGIEPDASRATDIVRRCYEKGVLMFAPVGYSGASVKVSPPLCISAEPLSESLAVLEEAMSEAADSPPS